MGADGVQQKLNVLEVSWDGEHQVVNLKFDNTEFKTWDFVLGVLAMAKDRAELMKRQALLANMQQQAADEQVRRQLLRGA